MEDLIRRSDAIKCAKRLHNLFSSPFYNRGRVEMIEAYFNAIPFADIDLSEYSDKLWKNAYERGKADRPQGEWIPSDTDGFVCSVCKNGYRNQPTLMGRPMFEYCPVCGARMKGADDE